MIHLTVQHEPQSGYETKGAEALKVHRHVVVSEGQLKAIRSPGESPGTTLDNAAKSLEDYILDIAAFMILTATEGGAQEDTFQYFNAQRNAAEERMRRSEVGTAIDRLIRIEGAKRKKRAAAAAQIQAEETIEAEMAATALAEKLAKRSPDEIRTSIQQLREKESRLNAAVSKAKGNVQMLLGGELGEKKSLINPARELVAKVEAELKEVVETRQAEEARLLEADTADQAQLRAPAAAGQTSPEKSGKRRSRRRVGQRGSSEEAEDKMREGTVPQKRHKTAQERPETEIDLAREDSDKEVEERMRAREESRRKTQEREASSSSSAAGQAAVAHAALLAPLDFGPQGTSTGGTGQTETRFKKKKNKKKRKYRGIRGRDTLNRSRSGSRSS
jgi:hypothetical protein